MSKTTKYSELNRALWQKRFLDARLAEVDLDFWNTIAFSPAKVHPRMLEKLGVQSSLLSQVCREPVLLAQAIIQRRAPDSTSPLDDAFMEHCMEIDPLDHCQCDQTLQHQQELFAMGQISQTEFFAAVSREFLRVTADKFVDHKPTDEDHADMEEVIRREQKWLHVFDDAAKFLGASFGRRRMNIITNMMWYGLQHFDRKEVNNRPLKEYFQYIISSSTVHVRKPKQEFFTRTAEITGTPLGRRLIVEDSITNIRSGVDAGYAYAVLVNRDDELTEEEIEALPDNVLVVEDLMQLNDVLPEFVGW